MIVLEALVDRHRRPPVRPHRQREVVADRRAGVLAAAVGHLHPVAAHAADRPVADRRRPRRRAAARSERPCVRCAGSTPNTSASVAWRSTFVVSASTPARGVRPRPASGSAAGCGRAVRTGGPSACPRCRPRVVARRTRLVLAEVVAVVGAHDDGGVVPQVLRGRVRRGAGRTSGRSSRAWRRSWRGSGGPRRSVIAPVVRATDDVRRPDERGRRPSGSSSYIDAHGSGVSNGSCGSNSSTNSSQRSCAALCIAAATPSRRAIVRGPGKSSSSRNQVRLSS